MLISNIYDRKNNLCAGQPGWPSTGGTGTGVTRYTSAAAAL